MKGKLCPNCGHFSLEFKAAYLQKDDAYVCADCGASFPVESVDGSVSIDRDSMQRFPNPADAGGEDSLNKFLKGKKQ